MSIKSLLTKEQSISLLEKFKTDYKKVPVENTTRASAIDALVKSLKLKREEKKMLVEQLEIIKPSEKTDFTMITSEDDIYLVNKIIEIFNIRKISKEMDTEKNLFNIDYLIERIQNPVEKKERKPRQPKAPKEA